MDLYRPDLLKTKNPRTASSNSGIFILACEGINVVLFRLESENDVEVTQVLDGAWPCFVETDTIVETKCTEHRQEYADTTTNRALKLEWVEVATITPGVGTLRKGQDIDRRAWVQRQWVAQLEGELTV